MGQRNEFVWPLLLGAAWLLGGCDARTSSERPFLSGAPKADLPHLNNFASSKPTAEDSGPIRIGRMENMDPDVFVLRGGPRGQGRLVLLHGMCGHGLGYAQAFQHAAAEKGRLIAPQADVICGAGPFAKWTQDVSAIDARIVDAFRQLGDENPTDICVIGVSQGATRAAALSRHFPVRYTRLISIGAPTEVKPVGLENLRAAVLMVAERERKDLMLQSERALGRAGVPSRSMIIPDADHAGMGPTPERTMDAALDWLWDNSKERGPSGE